MVGTIVSILIFLIFSFGAVAYSAQDSAYKTSLRLPLVCGKGRMEAQDITAKEALQLYVRERFEELRKRYGSKAAWLIILKELKLDEKLGFIIPDFVCFEHEEAKAIYDRWQNQDIESMHRSINEAIVKIIGEGWQGAAHLFELAIYLIPLYGLEVPDEEFRKHLDLLFEKEFVPLLKYATKEEWIDFFTAMRQSHEIKRLIDNKKQKYPLHETFINRNVTWYLRKAIRNFLFYNTFSNDEKRRLSNKLTNLPMRLIVRASGLDEDTFETAMAGRYRSKTVDKFTWLYGLVVDIFQQWDPETDEFLYHPHTVFIQEFIPAQKSGIVFSNLCGYTTIECVVGDGSMATAGVNNTIIDLNQRGEIEGIYYGSSNIKEGIVTRISWDGRELDCSEVGTLESMQRIWNDNTSDIENIKGEIKKSPFSKNEIQSVRKITLALEEILGFPVDNEINFKDGKLYLVQNRPITGLNSPMPEPLPEFKEEDIIEKVPISIGRTPEEGFLGYLVGFEDADNEIRCSGYVCNHLYNPGVSPDTAIPVTRGRPLGYMNYGYKVVIDSETRSRICHPGIRFREKNIVVAGIPGIQTQDSPNLKWRKAEITAKGIKMKYLISAEKVRYFSNGFRGVLVRGDAVPLKAPEEEPHLSLQRIQRDDL